MTGSLLGFETKVTGINFFLVNDIEGFSAKEKGIYIFKTTKIKEAEVARLKGFKYICTNISFHRDLKKIINLKLRDPFIQITVTNEYSIEDSIIDDIVMSFRESHYFRSAITKRYAMKIYKEWLYNNLFRGRTKNFFAVHEGNLVGLICFLEKKDNIAIDILWIKEKYRGKKLGRYLILEGIKNLGISDGKVIVETQCSNISAVNLYLALFEIKDIKFIFHYLKE